MADNDLAMSQLEVDPRHVRLNESQEATSVPQFTAIVDSAEQEQLPIRLSTGEPRRGADSSEQALVSGGIEEAEVSALPQHVASPKPPPSDDSSNVVDEHSSLLEPAQETAANTIDATVAPTPMKRFTSMNINKKFLAKAAGVSPSSASSTTAPKPPTASPASRLAMPNPAAPSKLVTRKLTTATPTLATGGWLRATPPASLSSSPVPGDVSTTQSQSSAKPPGHVDSLKRPTLAPTASTLSNDSRLSAATSRDQSPVKAWASIPASTGDLGRNLQGFPTAAEAAASAEHSEGQGVKRSGALPAHTTHNPDLSVHGDEGDTRDSFRGVHLDPKAQHWDEMEDESNDFLGEAIDFGDGKTYTIPLEEEENTMVPVSKESRFGDDYDRSWPRTQSVISDADGTHVGQLGLPHSRLTSTHGLPLRQTSGDGRVLFNERSNRLEPARLPSSAHVIAPSNSQPHGPQVSHTPARASARRNSVLNAPSISERPKTVAPRDPPPHTRDCPPHGPTGPSESRMRRPSDTRSTYSPVERRSSFLQDGVGASRGRVSDESAPGFGARRETSRDSRMSAGERQPWSATLQRTTSQRSSHIPESALALSLDRTILDEGSAEGRLLSPLNGSGTLSTVPSDPLPATALSDEREKYMRQAADRARRRKQEEEAAREETRERARKKAAELEALTKASLVSTSPLVALTRKSSSTGLPSGAKSPVPESPPVSSAALPPSLVSKAPPGEPKQILEPTSVVAVTSSWRAKPKPEVSSPVPEAPQLADAQSDSTTRPFAATLLPGHGAGPIEQLDQADEPVEILDFSDLGRLAGRRTSITSGSDIGKSSSEWRATQNHPPSTHWDRGGRNERPPSDHIEGRARVPSGSSKHLVPGRLQDSPSAKSIAVASSNAPVRSNFKEAPISALDDVISRIKGVLTEMHSDSEKVTVALSQPVAPDLPPVPPTTRSQTAHASVRHNPRWKGDDVANWRDSPNKRLPNTPSIAIQPTEPFAVTRLERPETPPPAWKNFAVRLNKISATRPPMSKKQAALAKLPPMPVRWDILTWDPPVERMSTRTLSRDETFFPKITRRGTLGAYVKLPSAAGKQNESPTQKTRLTLTAGPDPKPSHLPNIRARAAPKGPAFSETQWRKPQVMSPLRNTLELHDHVAASTEESQLETTSRSPPPHHATLSQVIETPSTNRTAPKQSRDTDVAFHRSLQGGRSSIMPAVSFTVSSELDNPAEIKENIPDILLSSDTSVEDRTLSASKDETPEPDLPGNATGDVEKAEPLGADTSGDKSATPNSSVLLTPPVKTGLPWQTSNPRLPDADFIKSVWRQTPPREGQTAENSLRGLVDDFPSSLSHSIGDMRMGDEGKPIQEPAAVVSARGPHGIHRVFQQASTSPVPMQTSYPNAGHLSPSQVGPSRPITFSLPPPAPSQITPQPTPYPPFVHPVPPALMYAMPPSRIAPSPAPSGPPVWIQNQGYGRPSPPIGMYPAQPGHNPAYPSPISQLPQPMSKPQAPINGNHGHYAVSSQAMPPPMHMTNPAVTHMGHMGSPALAHAAPHMPGGPQQMYSGLNSPVGMGIGGSLSYGAQRPTPTMIQSSPMQGPAQNGYGMSPSGLFGPAGYGRGSVRSPADGVPHQMNAHHPPHVTMSPGAYHSAPNGYAPW